MLPLNMMPVYHRLSLMVCHNLRVAVANFVTMNCMFVVVGTNFQQQMCALLSVLLL